jgi:SAM-dependent methyltransferase
MNLVKEHYDKHLAYFYSWMLGDYNEKLSLSKAFFLKHDIKPFSNGLAIDLGAGSGVQSIPLAELGFKVIAVDFSKVLTDELNTRKGILPIEVIEDDILSFGAYSAYNPELIVCMGDTITHLASIDQILALFENSYASLTAGGKLILTFRDLTTELEEEKRFIQVKSDRDRILTCFLEYYPNYVKVFDVLNVWKDHKWEQKISYYHKLRLSGSQIEKYLLKLCFEDIIIEKQSGFTTIIAKKP